MNELYDIIKEVLESKERTFTWLSDKIGKSRQGLKASLINGSIRVDVLMLIATTLDKPLSFFFNPKDLGSTASDIAALWGDDLQDSLKKENDLLKKRFSEVEEQLDDKRMIIDLLKEKLPFALFGELVFKGFNWGDPMENLDNDQINDAAKLLNYPDEIKEKLKSMLNKG